MFYNAYESFRLSIESAIVRPMIRDSYIGIRVPSKMRKALERLAEADHRSLSSYITLALAKHLDQVQPPAQHANDHHYQGAHK